MPRTRAGVIEEPPPEALAVDPEEPCYGGWLFFDGPELGRAGCGNPECGWSGVPSSSGGVVSTRCPACERDRDDPGDVALVRGVDRLDDDLAGEVHRMRALIRLDELQRRLLTPPPRVPFVQREGVVRVERNAACPCGSKIKAKRCPCDLYHV